MTSTSERSTEQASAQAAVPVKSLTVLPSAAAPPGILAAAPQQQRQYGPTTPCPRRAGRPPGWPDATITAAGAGRAGFDVTPASPKGYHTTTQGQSHTAHTRVELPPMTPERAHRLRMSELPLTVEVSYEIGAKVGVVVRHLVAVPRRGLAWWAPVWPWRD